MSARNISFSQLGKNGRLGNQLFQIHSTLGIAERLGATAAFELGRELPVPYLVLGPIAMTGAFGSIAGRTGSVNQLGQVQAIQCLHALDEQPDEERAADHRGRARR